MSDHKKINFDFCAPTNFVTRKIKTEVSTSPYRSDFMRDRDRVLYSTAFRRLAGKTQIYLTGEDDHRRNRLTHTLEVSQIARTISHALKLDCDLTEAIALAHDLGHTPFGHAGEQLLHEIMVPGSTEKIPKSPLRNWNTPETDIFGFKHNIQSVRVVASIEDNYGEYGLNLTNYTLWGIQHHSDAVYGEKKVNTAYLDPNYGNEYRTYYSMKGLKDKEAWSFEAFVVREADEIAQWHHDLEDALRGNAMTFSEVCKSMDETLGCIMEDEGDKIELQELQELQNSTVTGQQIAKLSRIVVNTLVNRIVTCSVHNLNHLWSTNVNTTNKIDFFQNHNWDDKDIADAISLVKWDKGSKKIKKMKNKFRNMITEKIHHSRDVERMNAKGQYIIKKLFQAYFSHPQQLPDGAIVRYMADINQKVSPETGVGAMRIEFAKQSPKKKNKLKLMRVICDHIAGMTDHYAIEEYKKLYE